MKKFNIIACIIILILALVSAVASYFLYEKRVQFVNGWNEMSTAIVSSASAITAESKDKTAGSKVTKDALDHKKYDSATFKTTVNNLPVQVQTFIKQYNNALEERKLMNEAISSNSEKFAAREVKLPAVKEVDEENTETAAEENAGNAEAAEAAEASEEKAETAGEVAENAADAPESIKAIAFDNDPAGVEKQIAAFNEQSDKFFEKYDTMKSDLENLRRKHAKLEADYKTMTAERDSLKKDKANLETLNNTLNKNLKVVTGQRDYMAKVFSTFATATGADANYRNPNHYKDVQKSSDRIDFIHKKVDAIIKNRTAMIQALVEVAKANGENIDGNKLLTDPKKGLEPLRLVVNKQRSGRVAYGNALSSIASSLGVTFKDNIQNAHINPQVVINAVSGKNREAANLKNALIQAGKEKQKAETTIQQQKNRIAKLEADAREFAKANKLEVSGGDIEIKNWPRGSVEARQATVGTVTKVSNDYGYVVIDFGTETTVVQEIGKKRIPVNPDLQSGLKFNVVRNGKFVAAITLRIVDKKESTADIPPSKAGAIQVGDKVVFAK